MRATENVSRLHKLTQDLVRSQDPADVKRRIVAGACELAGARAGLLLLLRAEGGYRIEATQGLLGDEGLLRHEILHEPVLPKLRKRLPLLDASPIESVPLPEEEGCRGLLVLGVEGDLSAEERWALGVFAEQAAVILAHARRHEGQVREHWIRSVRLAEVSRRLSALLDLESIMGVVCRAARELTGCDAASFVLREGDTVRYAAEDSPSRLWKGRSFPIDACVSGWVIRHGTTAIVTDIESDPRIPIEEYRATFVRSAALAPIRPEDPLGALAIYWAVPRRATSTEIEVLIALADAAAIAVVNARLYEQMREARTTAERRTEALVRLQEVSAELTREERASLYSAVIERICRVVGAPIGVFWLLDERAGEEPILRSRWWYGLDLEESSLREGSEIGRFLSRAGLEEDRPISIAARTRNSVVVDDVREEMVWLRALAPLLPHQVRSVLALPLRARGRLLGVVSLYWRDRGVAAQPWVLHVGQVIANQVAATLEASRLVEELSRANRLKDEFLATLSHELRNPLNVIVGYADLLARTPEAQSSPAILEPAQSIFRNAMAQARLVSDLLDLSRLQTGKLVLQKHPIRIYSIVRDAIETVRAEAEEKRVRLATDLQNSGESVQADPIRIQQIVWNLLTNAIEFTPPGGKVSIALRSADGWLELIVEDTGEGIEPSFLPEVFRMFRQADSSSVRRHGGLGIGLALVRQLVDLHGGTIWAESDGMNKGSRFTVRLPIEPAAERAGAAGGDGEEPATILRDLRVLAVDDSRDTVAMLGRLLRLEGARVETATGGEEALRRLDAEDFDLVVCDISMPGMDGYQMLERLRAGKRNATAPAIALTGFGQEADRRRASEAGFQAHLTKPVHLEQLVTAAGGG
ncbi:MAG: ATP-binding protein, partial [Candidatus Eisenbacteria bacterium]|nr:ATP-binding protein [Candidatus Eisenbacteria bacterium]